MVENAVSIWLVRIVLNGQRIVATSCQRIVVVVVLAAIILNCHQDDETD
jgi:hypothetical protein